MSKIDITRSCGHVEVVNICGPYCDRGHKAACEAEKSCREKKMLAVGCKEMAAEAASIAAEVRNKIAATWWIDHRQSYGAQDAYRDRLRDWAREHPELSRPAA